MRKYFALLIAMVAVILAVGACSAQDPSGNASGAHQCDGAVVGGACTTDKLLCTNTAPNLICLCGAFVTVDEYDDWQRIGATCVESPAPSTPGTPMGPECTATKPCSQLDVKCYDASSRLLTCTPCGWMPASMTCPIAPPPDAGKPGACSMNGIECAKDIPEGATACDTAPIPYVCCKQASGVKMWVAGKTCGGAPPPADAGTDAASADCDTTPADTGIASDSAKPVDSGTSPADTGTASDSGSSPPFDAGPSALVAWLDPVKYPGCRTVVWDNAGVELKSDIEKPLVVTTDSTWRGWAFSMALCPSGYKILASVGANAETAGYKQLTLWGVDYLKKAAVCPKPYGTADKLAVPVDKPDMSCP